uniref:Regulatory protein zeste n=1 Tax=Diabrotica virgifera virgifera TaxID=50390 RepID=A0A6P7GTZ0_DIAVI
MEYYTPFTKKKKELTLNLAVDLSIICSCYFNLFLCVYFSNVKMELEGKRGSRMTKGQKEHLVTFVENHRLLLQPRLKPSEIRLVKDDWLELSKQLNSLGGSQKSVSQWKETFNDFKTTVRRKARQLHIEAVGTGGGPKTLKNLTPLEERVLALISKTSIIGVDVPEVGILMPEENDETNRDNVPSCSWDHEIEQPKIVSLYLYVTLDL